MGSLLTTFLLGGCCFYVLQPWLVRCGFVFSAVVDFAFYRLGFYVVVLFFIPRLLISTPYRSCRGGTSFARSGKGCKTLFGPSRRSAVAVNFSAVTLALILTLPN